MHKNVLLIPFLVLLSVLSLFAQKEQPVAKAGSSVITLEYFENRYKLSPQLSVTGQTKEKDRYNFLYTLIAEKLWAEYAREKGLDTSALLKRSFEPLKKMYLRDALFRKEIAEKVKITPVELLQTFSKLRFTLNVKFLFTEDSTEALSFYLLLNSGTPIDSLLQGRTEYEYQKDGLDIAFTKSNDAALEEKLYGLKQPGEVLKPYKDKNGWFVFQLMGLKDNLSQENTAERIQKTAKELLEVKKTDSIYQVFYKKFFGGMKVETNGDLFWSFHAKLIYLMSRDSLNRKDERFQAGLEYLDEISGMFGKDTLGMPFLKIGNKPVLLSEFLILFLFERFSTASIEPQHLSIILNNRVKFIIEQELLYREALKRGMDKLPETANEIAMWREHYLAAKGKEVFHSGITVTEDDAQELYRRLSESNTGTVSVNLREIETDSLIYIQKVLERIKKGESFDELAKIYNKSERTKNSGGETGLVPAEELGDIGYVAKALNKGDIYGPLRINERYVIFYVIEKQIDSSAMPAFDSVKSAMMTAALREKKQKETDAYTAKMAETKGVTINSDVMKKSDAENLQMILFRFMGFGGRIVAFPVTAPDFRWTEEWKNKPPLLP